MQLNIKSYKDTVFEWIPYNQFSEIKKTGKNNSITVYSAIWKNGPLYYKLSKKGYGRNSNEKVALKYLHNLQNTFDEFLTNEVPIIQIF
jgi:hypothetical protein